jgi:hypothetical protein
VTATNPLDIAVGLEPRDDATNEALGHIRRTRDVPLGEGTLDALDALTPVQTPE